MSILPAASFRGIEKSLAEGLGWIFKGKAPAKSGTVCEIRNRLENRAMHPTRLGWHEGVPPPLALPAADLVFSRLLSLAALAAVLCLTAKAQVAILQIQVTGGEGAVHTPGARDARAIAVVVTDETGHPVEGAAVSFHLPEQGPSGSFVNGLRTEVATTDERGRAAVRSIEYNRVPGRFEIRIVASKEQARAGTVSFQYINGASPGTASASATAKTKGGWHPRKKWLILAAVAGAGAAGGAVALSHASPSSSSTDAATVFSIGTPSITVSKP